MRRKLPKEIAEHQGAYDLSPSGTREPLLDVTIGLECITPVIGGGVRAREPDTVDIVRVSGIRGQLRFWWRALGSEPDPTTLFANEVRIWGGVSGGANGAAVASRVRVSIEKVDDEGKSFPAGMHERKRDGRGLKPMPTWDPRCRDLGYGMFPLQRNKIELDDAPDSGQHPTWEVRSGLRFTLRLHLRSAVAGESSKDDQDDVERILWTLWAWIHFGGIGGRTTRGFGALAPTANVTSLPSAWTQRFTRPRSSDATAWLLSSWQQGPMRCTAPPGAAGWTHFSGSQLAVGAAMDEGKAHSMLLNKLRMFRQGVPMGRVESTRGKPAGRSQWPEPDVLRVHAESAKRAIQWAHTPSPATRALISPTPTSTEWIPPRAAFGLPIVVKFMDDRDSPAEATIGLDRPGGRWMSPLRLRPIACSDGKHIPVALLFSTRPWSCARDSITVDGKPIYLKVGAAQPGPTGPIASDGWMARGSGDAARAFFEWLRADRTFRRRP
ncbi:MAG TPA: type III-B CRISPR module RAMP protein Cmr1 [Kofleriaceae bacterium]|nr:type III-B CRISPR module RAMP protein Cmr1 [Kofleriaceae bacterium]